MSYKVTKLKKEQYYSMREHDKEGSNTQILTSHIYGKSSYHVFHEQAIKASSCVSIKNDENII